jgi:hypothetical protein
VTWRATALIYSGLRDPEWDVGPELAAMWDELPPLTGDAPEAPPLGYRGVALVAGGGARIDVYGGAAVRDRRELRADPGRELERAVLDSAPPGLVPEGISADEPR